VVLLPMFAKANLGRWSCRSFTCKHHKKTQAPLLKGPCKMRAGYARSNDSCQPRCCSRPGPRPSVATLSVWLALAKRLLVGWWWTDCLFPRTQRLQEKHTNHHLPCKRHPLPTDPPAGDNHFQTPRMHEIPPENPGGIHCHL